MYDHIEGHRGKSSKDRSHQKNAATHDKERDTEVDRPSGFAEQVHLAVSREVAPFLQGLKGSKNFHWGPEQHKAFEELKQYLENLAVMTSPSPRAELLLYIAASSSTVSAALVEERMVEEMLKQFPIYFVSEALSGLKPLYSEMQW